MPSPPLSGKTRMILGRIEILLKINTAFWLSGFILHVEGNGQWNGESLPGTKMFEDTEGLLVDGCEVLFFLPDTIRRLALGWPLTVSQ